MSFDLSTMNAADLANLSEAIALEKERAIARSRNEIEALVSEIITKCNALGVDVKEFFFPKTASKITHRNPDNENEVWRGRGAKPKWIVKAIEGLSDEDAAAKIESFKV